MKGKRIFFAISAILLVLSIVLVSCGGSDPKSLAKQVYDLTQKVQAASEQQDWDAIVKLGTEEEGLKAKVDKLSDADRAVFEEELSKLMFGD